VDGGDKAQKKRRRFRRVEKEVGGREHECRYGYWLRWKIGWRGREEKDAGQTASRSISGRFLNDLGMKMHQGCFCHQNIMFKLNDGMYTSSRRA